MIIIVPWRAYHGTASVPVLPKCLLKHLRFSLLCVPLFDSSGLRRFLHSVTFFNSIWPLQRKTNMEHDVTPLDNTIKEMITLRKALPLRPPLLDLQAAILQIDNVDNALASQLERLSRQRKPDEVLASVFDILQEMRKDAFKQGAQQKKRHAEVVVQLEQRHRRYDDWIQSAVSALASESQNGRANVRFEFMNGNNTRVKLDPDIQSDSLTSKTSELQSLQEVCTDKVDPKLVLTRSLSSLSGPSSGLIDVQRGSSGSSSADVCLSSTKPGNLFNAEPKIASPTAANGNGLDSSENGSMEDSTKVFNVLDYMTVEDGFKILNLQGVFLKELEWIPESLGQLTWLTQLNLSGNLLASLPDSIGALVNLSSLDVSANRLVWLPDTLGQLTALVTLNIEKNRIEELPWTVGQCKGLNELRADFNHLKAVPEAVGNLANLRVLTLHLNCLKSLPSTMASMKSLVELDVHFNQLESVPENLCLVTTLVRLNLSSNFIDLKELPQSIGRLRKLKDLDISYNHLTVLPDSFALLTNLHTLNLEGNPLKLPPLYIAEQGTEAVLSYMVDHVSQKERELRVTEKRGLLAKLIFRIIRQFTKGNTEATDYLQLRA